MDLNELKALMAASILGGLVGSGMILGPKDIYEINGTDISRAVKLSHKIWEEVLKQEREN